MSCSNELIREIYSYLPLDDSIALRSCNRMLNENFRIQTTELASKCMDTYMKNGEYDKLSDLLNSRVSRTRILEKNDLDTTLKLFIYACENTSLLDLLVKEVSRHEISLNEVIEKMLGENCLIYHARLIIDRYIKLDKDTMISIISGNFKLLFQKFLPQLDNNFGLEDLTSFIQAAVEYDSLDVFRLLFSKYEDLIFNSKILVSGPENTAQDSDYSFYHYVIIKEAVQIFDFLQNYYELEHFALLEYVDFSIRENCPLMVEYFMKMIDINFETFPLLHIYLLNHDDYETIDVMFKHFDFLSQMRIILLSFDARTSRTDINEHLFDKHLITLEHLKTIVRINQKMNRKLTQSEICFIVKQHTIEDYKVVLLSNVIDFDVAIECAIDNEQFGPLDHLLSLKPLIDDHKLDKIINSWQPFFFVILLKNNLVPRERILERCYHLNNFEMFDYFLETHKVRPSSDLIKSAIENSKFKFLKSILKHSPDMAFLREYKCDFRQYLLRHSNFSQDKILELLNVMKTHKTKQ
ncbi:hypothetical protein ROZALSC1DRAFT_30234 [Rozella allomycis CSF55]|uniref:F-box domain-containing protein n=1 Tax=Rozella allomycis (strain CSF55) TaxID=988480 RepID=A0A4P9YFS9_ROZAC|nr:hypothetical protein ROZALSC1DRAFT_30234 [Rozella allomycis CSF55]